MANKKHVRKLFSEDVHMEDYRGETFGPSQEVSNALQGNQGLLQNKKKNSMHQNSNSRNVSSSQPAQFSISSSDIQNPHQGNVQQTHISHDNRDQQLKEMMALRQQLDDFNAKLPVFPEVPEIKVFHLKQPSQPQLSNSLVKGNPKSNCQSKEGSKVYNSENDVIPCRDFGKPADKKRKIISLNRMSDGGIKLKFDATESIVLEICRDTEEISCIYPPSSKSCRSIIDIPEPVDQLAISESRPYLIDRPTQDSSIGHIEPRSSAMRDVNSRTNGFLPYRRSRSYDGITSQKNSPNDCENIILHSTPKKQILKTIEKPVTTNIELSNKVNNKQEYDFEKTHFNSKPLYKSPCSFVNQKSTSKPEKNQERSVHDTKKYNGMPTYTSENGIYGHTSCKNLFKPISSEPSTIEQSTQNILSCKSTFEDCSDVSNEVHMKNDVEHFKNNDECLNRKNLVKNTSSDKNSVHTVEKKSPRLLTQSSKNGISGVLTSKSFNSSDKLKGPRISNDIDTYFKPISPVHENEQTYQDAFSAGNSVKDKHLADVGTENNNQRILDNTHLMFGIGLISDQSEKTIFGSNFPDLKEHHKSTSTITEINNLTSCEKLPLCEETAVNQYSTNSVNSLRELIPIVFEGKKSLLDEKTCKNKSIELEEKSNNSKDIFDNKYIDSLCSTVTTPLNLGDIEQPLKDVPSSQIEYFSQNSDSPSKNPGQDVTILKKNAFPNKSLASAENVDDLDKTYSSNKNLDFEMIDFSEIEDWNLNLSSTSLSQELEMESIFGVQNTNDQTLLHSNEKESQFSEDVLNNASKEILNSSDKVSPNSSLIDSFSLVLEPIGNTEESINFTSSTNTIESPTKSYTNGTIISSDLSSQTTSNCQDTVTFPSCNIVEIEVKTSSTDAGGNLHQTRSKTKSLFGSPENKKKRPSTCSFCVDKNGTCLEDDSEEYSENEISVLEAKGSVTKCKSYISKKRVIKRTVKRKRQTNLTESKRKKSLVVKESDNFTSVESIFQDLEKIKFTKQNFKRNVNQLVRLLMNPKHSLDTVNLIFHVIQHLRKTSKNSLINPSNKSIGTEVFYLDSSNSLPATEDFIVYALIKIQEENSDYHSLLDSTVITFYNLVFGKQFEFSFFDLVSFCKILTKICKHQNDKVKPLKLSIELLKWQHQHAHYLIASIATIWPEVFQLTSNADKEEIICFSAIALALQKKPEKLPDFEWQQLQAVFSEVLPVKSAENKLIPKAVCFIISRISSKCFHTVYDKDYLLTTPLVLFARIKGCEWAREVLQKPFIEPYLQKYISNETAFEFLLNLYAEIQFQFPKEEDPYGLLKFYFEKGTAYVHFTAAIALMKLVIWRGDYFSRIICHWMKKFGTHDRVMAIQDLFIRRLMLEKEFSISNIITDPPIID